MERDKIIQKVPSTVLRALVSVCLAIGLLPFAAFADSTVKVKEEKPVQVNEVVPVGQGAEWANVRVEASDSDSGSGEVIRSSAVKPSADEIQASGNDQSDGADPFTRIAAEVPVDSSAVTEAVLVDGLAFEIDHATGQATLLGWYGEALVGDFAIPSQISDGSADYCVVAIGRSPEGTASTRVSSTQESDPENHAGGGLNFSAAELRSVSVPSTVESIDPHFFSGCADLQSISVSSYNRIYSSFDGMLFTKDQTKLLSVPEGKEGTALLPDTIEAVPAGAFSQNARLTSLSVGEGCTAYSSENGILYASDGKTLVACAPGYGSSVVIAEHAESIAPAAFAGCTLASIVVLGNVSSIDSTAFDDATKQSATVVLKADGDFDVCKAVWERAGFTHFETPAQPGDVQAPAPETSGFLFELLDDWTLSVSWQGNADPESDLAIPATAEVAGVSYRVSAVAAGAFENRASLHSVAIPSSVRTIGVNAFRGCSALANIELSEGLASIGDLAFASSALEELFLPTSVSFIDSQVFAGCAGLSRVVALGDIAAVAADALADCSGVSVLTPYREDGAYEWNPGLPSLGNHIEPYGVSLPAEPLALVVGESSSLGTRSESTSSDCIELRYSYPARCISIDGEDMVFGKGSGEAAATVVLAIDDRVISEAERTVVVSGSDSADSTILSIDGSQEAFPCAMPLCGVPISLLTAGMSPRAATVTVTFETFMGTVTPPTQTVEVGGKLLDPGIPSGVTGFLFLGWWTEPNGLGKKWSFSDPVTTSMTLYAYLSDGSVTITFDANGGTPATQFVRVSSGSTASAPSTPKLANYTFQGWFTAKTGGTVFSTSTKFERNATYYAQWKYSTRTVTFHPNNGEADIRKSVENGTAVAAPSVSKTGYTLSGWYKDAALTRLYSFSTAVTADMALWAFWTPNSYNVSFDVNGGTGTVPPPVNAVYDESFAMPGEGDLTKRGHMFSGWSTSPDGSGTLYEGGEDGVWNVSSTPNGSVTLYARWSPITYIVGFSGNGSTDGSTASATFTYGASNTLTKNGFERTGYDFKGWATSAEKADAGIVEYSDGGTVTDDLADTQDTDVTLYAVWAAKHYTITYDLAGGEGTFAMKQDVVYGTKLSQPSPDPTKESFEFDSWFSSELSRTWNFGSDTVPDHDFSLIAQWAGDAYSVTFDSNDGAGRTSVQAGFNYGVKKSLQVNAFTREGHTFDGWNTSPDGSGDSYGDAAMVLDLPGSGDSATLYAQWKEHTYSIAFDPNPPEGCQVSGDTATVKSVLYTKETVLPVCGFMCDGGLAFAYWTLTKDGSGTRYADGDAVSGLAGKTSTGTTITLYAQWRGKPYTVHFDGTYTETIGALPDQTFYRNGWYALPDSGFSLAGSVFAGWSTDKTKAEAGIAEYLPGASVKNLVSDEGAGEVTLYAVWTERISVTSPIDPTIEIDAQGKLTPDATTYFESSTSKPVVVVSATCVPVAGDSGTIAFFSDTDQWKNIYIALTARGASENLSIEKGKVDLGWEVPAKTSDVETGKLPVAVSLKWFEEPSFGKFSEDPIPVASLSFTFALKQ